MPRQVENLYYREPSTLITKINNEITTKSIRDYSHRSTYLTAIPKLAKTDPRLFEFRLDVRLQPNLLIFNPWIDPGVDEIDRDTSNHHDRGKEHHNALYRRIIAIRNCFI